MLISSIMTKKKHTLRPSNYVQTDSKHWSGQMRATIKHNHHKTSVLFLFLVGVINVLTPSNFQFQNMKILLTISNLSCRPSDQKMQLGRQRIKYPHQDREERENVADCSGLSCRYSTWCTWGDSGTSALAVSPSLPVEAFSYLVAVRYFGLVKYDILV